MNAQKRNVTLYYEGVSCMLRADRGMISELVENLCQNAIRYNNEGGEVHVRVYYEKDSRCFLWQTMVSGFQKTSRNVFLSGFTVLIKQIQTDRWYGTGTCYRQAYCGTA